MKRRLTYREIVLLVILFVLAAGSAFYFLFYSPVKTLKELYQVQILDIQDQIDMDQIRLANMRRMEKELEDLLADSTDFRSLPNYSNRESVMFLLNDALLNADSFSINFEVVEPGEKNNILLRKINIEFKCKNYTTAREIIETIYNGPNRCIFDDLTISSNAGANDGGFHWVTWEQVEQGQFINENHSGTQQDDTLSVSTTIIFFEYQE